MAAKTCKVTCSLEPDTLRRVQKLAKQWGVTKSEVMRVALSRLLPLKKEAKVLTPMQAFLYIQKTGGISRKVAEKWCAEIRRERWASGIAMSRRSEKAWAEAGLKY